MTKKRKGGRPRGRSGHRSRLQPQQVMAAALALAIVAYAASAYSLWFIQDDAFIAYRYVANFLNGNGLVFNPAEFVEGYTNFGWVLYLSFWGALGVDYVAVSQVTGFICGAGVLYVTWLMARHLFEKTEPWFALLPLGLLACNQALAYWSPAGLETAAFALFVHLAFYQALRGSRGLAISLLIAVLLRPEGALVAFLLIAVEWIVRRRFPRSIFLATLAAFVLCLPWLAFKLQYYGSLLPNPFYAKTSWNLDQVVSGAEYAGLFFSHYAFSGAGLLVAIFLYRRLSASERCLLLFCGLYVLYVVLIGGDVLKVHRFFTPVVGLFAILAAVALARLTEKIRGTARLIVLLAAGVPLVVLSFWLPRDFVRYYNAIEGSFVDTQRFVATQLKRSDTTRFSIATPTIGVLGYELLGHDVIDLVGLTDTTIARHPEPPLEGLASTWRESHFNTPYVLSRAPDYIRFSTGIKPSSPAEQSLLLYRQFQEGYRAITWVYDPADTKRPFKNTVTFKRLRPLQGEFVPAYPIAFVSHYKRGLELTNERDMRGALAAFNRALAASPQPYYVYLLTEMAFAYFGLQQPEQGEALLEHVLKEDSLVYRAHQLLYPFALQANDSTRAVQHERMLQQLVPWLWPWIKENPARMHSL